MKNYDREDANRRMFFAFSRGAQLQVKNYEHRAWTNCYFLKVPLSVRYDDTQFRVNPKDAHLLYGVVSSALRERLIYGSSAPREVHWFCDPLVEGLVQNYLGNVDFESLESRGTDDFTREMFYLMAAEEASYDGL